MLTFRSAAVFVFFTIGFVFFSHQGEIQRLDRLSYSGPDGGQDGAGQPAGGGECGFAWIMTVYGIFFNFEKPFDIIPDMFILSLSLETDVKH